MKNSSRILGLLLVLIMIFVPDMVKANIVCNDGTVSRSCADCHRGCCSHHGGCANNPNIYNNSGGSKSSSNGSIRNNSTKSKSSTSKNNNGNISDSNAYKTETNEDSDSSNVGGIIGGIILLWIIATVTGESGNKKNRKRR